MCSCSSSWHFGIGLMSYLGKTDKQSRLTDTNTPLIWTPQFKKDIDVLELVQRKGVELLKGLESNSYKKQLRKLGLFSWEKAKLGRPHYCLQFPERRLQPDGGWSLPPGSQWQDNGKWPSAEPGKVQVVHHEAFLQGKFC